MRAIEAGRPLLCLLALLTACGQPAATAKASNALISYANSARETRTMTTIEIDAGTRQWTAQIADSPSARDFLAQLPLDLTLTDYAATEKVATLPRPLTRDGAPAAVTPRAGEIGYFAVGEHRALPQGRPALSRPRDPRSDRRPLRRSREPRCREGYNSTARRSSDRTLILRGRTPLPIPQSPVDRLRG